MWEYKIVKSDLWFNIYKKKEKNGLLYIRFLSWDGKRVLNKSYARTFYHREDALSTLATIKYRDGKDTD